MRTITLLLLLFLTCSAAHAADPVDTLRKIKRMPIVGPITYGDVPVAHAPPSSDEVMRRVLEQDDSAEGGDPLLRERSPSNVRITIEPIAVYVDPPRVYPLIGRAQQHHAQYKCTIYSSDTPRVGLPVPDTTVAENPRRVIYIDHNHLHIVGRKPESDRRPEPMPSTGRN
jgi:hypothetical protein